VGDSITAGSRTKIPELDAYPSQLQRMLPADSWVIGNFGVSGATLLNSGDKPYQKQPAFEEAIAFKADIVVIMLGTNDTKPQNWVHKEEFRADYHDLIAKFRRGEHRPQIYVCRPPPVIGEGNFGINQAAMAEELPLIDEVVRTEHAELIDQRHTLAGREVLIEDRVHPNTDGARELARTVYRVLRGREFGGELSPVLRTEWMGFAKTMFECDGRLAYVVEPKRVAPGRPWIWRPEYFGVEPQTELALLARGWHAAYIELRNLYGAPVALDAMDVFYDRARHDFGLGPKVVLAGFSRGGLFAFNWAARHPDRVADIYADAPVLDFKSWPGGKGKGKGSPADWERCLKVYALTDAQAATYRLNPLDNLAPLAKAHIPILAVVGDSDQTVPYEENTKIAESRYAALGGSMQVIVKPGGDHHPHSLKDPQPIVEFIQKYATPANN
jgi:lysophospholipase L1-like esterase/pimeloyl-ACP methyl ester carboxylesterase